MVVERAIAGSGDGGYRSWASLGGSVGFLDDCC
jgi:hypothetical protein